MTKLQLGPAAAADLDDIWDYTEAQFGRAQAERCLRAIQQRLLGIADGSMPTRTADIIRPGYKKCSIQSHMIYFRYNSDEVFVVRILHQSMDVEQNLPGQGK